MKRLMDWIAGRCGYVPARHLRVASMDINMIARSVGAPVVPDIYDGSRWLSEAEIHAISSRVDRTQAALRAIIAQDTPYSNATVKRMVGIARDGLGGA